MSKPLQSLTMHSYKGLQYRLIRATSNRTPFPRLVFQLKFSQSNHTYRLYRNVFITCSITGTNPAKSLSHCTAAASLGLTCQ